MQKILWLGNPYFYQSLSAYGWEVAFYDFAEMETFSWDDIVRVAGFEPDILVVADKSLPPFVLGMENFPCFTILYVVDSHIHSWYPYYAQAFDACLVSLKDHIPFFRQKFLPDQNILWLPAFAKDEDKPNPSIEKRWDCLFVGTVNSETTPARKEFLEKLQQHIPLHITQGPYAQLFPQGRVILNYCEHGDLNFRVFEALACGSTLVTPNIGQGMTELFTPGKDLLLYDKNILSDVLRKIDFLLSHDKERESIAKQGFTKVDRAHRATHRASTFTDFLHALGQNSRQARIKKRQAHAAQIRKFWLRAPYLLLAESTPYPFLRAAYLQASKGSS